ncbi:unnamed protein product [Heterobilharzia americana]|nr:unnamed protein product [Heterobilharzia americana]
MTEIYSPKKRNKGNNGLADHFKKLLNRPAPTLRPEIPPAVTELQVNINPPTKIEVLNAIKMLKCGKAAGPDGIPPEALRTDAETTADMLTPHHYCRRCGRKGRYLAVDWKKGYLVKLPKKGDISVCKNWHGIMLLSTQSKQNIKPHHPRETKACTGFKTTTKTGRLQEVQIMCGSNCNATLRIITEQSIEWQSTLYLNFIDFEKAFDNVDREVIWKLLQYYGILQTFINLIQQLCEDATCQVIHNGKLSDAFGVKVKTGVKQGCRLLSPMIFLIVVEWIMQQTVRSENRGIR